MKIKAVHIITRLDKGGSAENTLLTVKGLDKTTYDVLLIRGPSGESKMSDEESRAVAEGVREAEAMGVRVLTVSSLIRKPSPFHDLKALFSLIGILRRERPHVVHTHTSKAGILGRWAAVCAQVPVIVHTPHGHVFWGYFGRLKTGFFILLERLTALITDRLIMLTEGEKGDHLHCRIAPATKLSVVHSGIDLASFSPLSIEAPALRQSLGIPRGNHVVGTMGRLTPIKGHRYLIEAAGHIVTSRPDTTFVFAGDGELADELAHMASLSGIERNVCFLGWRSDVTAVLSTFDVFVLPSLNEGMGRVLVEAMALRKPIVASDVGGIPDLVVDGENGYLVPAGDAKALAAQITKLIDSPGKRETMGTAGKRYAAGYSLAIMITKIDRIYRELLHEKAIAF